MPRPLVWVVPKVACEQRWTVVRIVIFLIHSIWNIFLYNDNLGVVRQKTVFIFIAAQIDLAFKAFGHRSCVAVLHSLQRSPLS